MRNFHICISKLLKDLLIYNIVNSSIQNTFDFNVTEYGSIFNNRLSEKTNDTKEEVKKVLAIFLFEVY